MKWRAAWRSPADLALLLFILMVAVSVAISPLPARALNALGPLALGLVLYLLLAKWPLSEEQWERLLRCWPWLLALLGGALGLIGLPGILPAYHALFRRLPPLALLQQRLSVSFNANVIAGALVVLMPFPWALSLAALSGRPIARWGQRFLAAALGAAMLAVVVISGSRGGYLATAAILLLLLAWRWPSVGKWGALVALLGVFGYGTLIGWSRVADSLVTGTAVGGLDARLEIWSRARAILSDFPLTGVGLGGFQQVVAREYPLFLVAAGTVTHAHNLYLQVAVDLGLPGLVAYLAILGLSYYELLAALRALRTEPWAAPKVTAVACLLSLVGICIHGLIDAAVWDNKGAFLPWVVMGLAAVLYRLYGRREVTV